MKLWMSAIVTTLILTVQLAAVSFDEAAALRRGMVSPGDQARLRQFYQRAEKGENLTVGVIGGSITEGARASSAATRYSSVLANELGKLFPKSKFTVVNAGIGATGSDYGAMRIERDLLSKKPDLVVIEFAVNDSEGKAFVESYEGVLRQVLKAPSQPAVILLFMLRKNGTNVQGQQIPLGEYYKLPMVSYRNALQPEIEAGKLKWEDLSPDEVHPNDFGQGLAGKLVFGLIKQNYQSYLDVNRTLSAIEPVPAAMNSERFEFCRLCDGEDLKPSAVSGWSLQPRGDKGIRAGWASDTPGSTIEFEIEGQSITLAYWRINGPMGIASVSVDGGPAKKLDAWFEKTWGGYRQSAEIATGLKPGKHLVKVELLAEKNAQSAGNNFRILGIGSTGAK